MSTRAPTVKAKLDRIELATPFRLLAQRLATPMPLSRSSRPKLESHMPRARKNRSHRHFSRARGRCDACEVTAAGDFRLRHRTRRAAGPRFGVDFPPRRVENGLHGPGARNTRPVGIVTLKPGHVQPVWAGHP